MKKEEFRGSHTEQNQQEHLLLKAFRAMHPEDREILLEYAQVSASRNAAPMPRLRLAVSNLAPLSPAPMANANRMN